VCDTNTKFKDVVSFYILNENGVIKEISVKCGPCDPYAYITSNILSKILKGLKIEQIRINNDMIYQEFLKSLDYRIDEDMRFHFETLLKILEDKLNEIK
jgi:NifU-like protein involved in Fe-S cluster formation